MPRVDKRQLIMQAAENLFTTRRFHEITTDEVARAAEVGKGTIYLYFRDKDDLFFQTATSGFDELCDLLQAGVAASAPFPQQLLDACRQITGFFEQRRALFRMMQSEDGRIALAKGSIYDRWLSHRRKLVAAVTEIIRRGVEKGEIRDDLPTEVLAEFLLGLLRTRTRDLRDAPPSARRHEVVVDMFCRGAGTQQCGTSKRGTRNSERGTQTGRKRRRERDFVARTAAVPENE
jgi:AcrR family transcriptional regulator